ncbi:MAG: GNAT family N-acetyltransferase [Acidaminobacteraceae bacterium]
MFKILKYSDFNEELVEHLIKFTYKESADEIFEESYLKLIDKEDRVGKELIYNKFKLDYYDFINLFMSEKQKSQFIAVIEEKGKFVSGVRAIELSQGIWLEEALETAVEFREHGHAMELVTSLIEELTLKKAELIVARVAKSNIESRNFHEKMNFIETSKDVIDENGIFYSMSVEYEYKL